jgi:hypothetical protein
MTEAIIAAVSALIGAALGFGGAWYSAVAERRLEYQKWLQSREDDVNRDIRLAVAEVVARLSEMAHSIMWFTFSSLNAVESRRSREHVEPLLSRFMDETHALIAQTVGVQYRLAALHLGMFQRVTPLVSEAIRLSEDAIHAAEGELDAEGLRGSNQAALALIKKLPNELGDTIGSVDTGSLRSAGSKRRR